MKNTEMTNLIRQKHTFLYHGQKFFCFDLSLWDYLLLMIDPVAGVEKILLECNDEIPKINERQSKEFMRILLKWEEEKSDNFAKALTETQKQINIFKEKDKEKNKKKVAGDINDMLRDFHLIEGQMMHHLGQPLQEMRSWPYSYFMDLYNDLPIINGTKEYDKNRHSKTPDKKAFKKEFGNLYDKKK